MASKISLWLIGWSIFHTVQDSTPGWLTDASWSCCVPRFETDCALAFIAQGYMTLSLLTTLVDFKFTPVGGCCKLGDVAAPPSASRGAHLASQAHCLVAYWLGLEAKGSLHMVGIITSKKKSWMPISVGCGNNVQWYLIMTQSLASLLFLLYLIPSQLVVSSSDLVLWYLHFALSVVRNLPWVVVFISNLICGICIWSFLLCIGNAPFCRYLALPQSVVWKPTVAGSTQSLLRWARGGPSLLMLLWNFKITTC